MILVQPSSIRKGHCWAAQNSVIRFMKGHTTAEKYGAQKFGFISSIVVLVTVVSINATASCFGVDIFRPLYPCSNMLPYVSAGEKSEYHNIFPTLCSFW